MPMVAIAPVVAPPPTRPSSNNGRRVLVRPRSNGSTGSSGSNNSPLSPTLNTTATAGEPRQPPNATTASTTSRDESSDTTAASLLYTYIVSLSESCRTHTNTAHSSHLDTSATNHTLYEGNDTLRETNDQHKSTATTYCYEAIRTLQRILPHIETTLRIELERCCIPQQSTIPTAATTTTNSTLPPPSTTTATSTTTNVPSHDHHHQQQWTTVQNMTLHMCDFYIDVVQGGFCPYASKLLQHPHQSTYT
jgi:hypothetical protein